MLFLSISGRQLIVSIAHRCYWRNTTIIFHSEEYCQRGCHIFYADRPCQWISTILDPYSCSVGRQTNQQSTTTKRHTSIGDRNRLGVRTLNRTRQRLDCEKLELCHTRACIITKYARWYVYIVSDANHDESNRKHILIRVFRLSFVDRFLVNLLSVDCDHVRSGMCTTQSNNNFYWLNCYWYYYKNFAIIMIMQNIGCESSVRWREESHRR